MVREFSAGQARRARMAAQQLAGRRDGDTAGLARSMVGLQAQDARAARLSVRARTDGTDAAAATRAWNSERSVVRTWAMRGTLHMVAAEDVGWLAELLGPVFAGAGRRRRLQLGLDDAVCERALPLLEEILAAEGPLTRAGVVARLADRGLPLDIGTQAPPHLLAYGAHRGLLCRGPDLDNGEPTYVLVRDWAGAQRILAPDEALAELARRYAASYGPAAPEDFLRWSGLPARQGRRGFELNAGELEEVRVEGAPAWVAVGTPVPPGPDGGAPHVRLLGHFDAYLLGYQDRSLVLDPAFAGRIQTGGGFVQPAVLVDGAVAGTWKLRRAKDLRTVEVQPFRALPDGAVEALAAEAADIGRFLGEESALRIAGAGSAER